MKVYVICEEDSDDHERIVIGVCDSISKLESVMYDYYSGFKMISSQDIRDSGLVCSYLLEVPNWDNKPYKVNVWVEEFEVN